ncbi:MAG: hypothetical protein AB8U44_03800 [Aaplasma endosymbiont of Hyalomma asiaticum]
MEKQKVNPEILIESHNQVTTLSKDFENATPQNEKEATADQGENATRIDHLSAILSRKSLST